MKHPFAVVVCCLWVPYGAHAGEVRYPAITESTGCLVEQITSAEYDEDQVQGVSGDGRLLAYASRYGEDNDGQPMVDVHILDLETGSKTRLPDAINNAGSFSPDGQFLVVAANDDTGRTEILELNIASGEISVIAPHEHWDWLPSYSADGRFIVFNSYRYNDDADVVIYERATGNLRRLTDYPGYDAHAQFSSDGRRILFNRMLGKHNDERFDFDLFVYDLVEETETRLTDGPLEESYGAYAPDGQHIVFSWDADEAPNNHNLYVRSPDGDVTLLTDGDWKDYYAYWTRDGKYIYFNSNRSGDFNVYRIPMEGASCVRN